MAMPSSVAHFARRDDAGAAAPIVIEAPYFEVNFDFRLDPADATA
jgi:hypothetical protein